MKCKVRGHRSRWVGPPVSAPTSEPSRSPSGRQKHYGAVELPGAGDQVNVNDVVEVEEHQQQQQGTSQQHPGLVQVLSMWEDTFTGVFKFRARWLVHSSGVPANALLRLRTTRQVGATDDNVTGSEMSLGKEQSEADEVFLTKRVKDLEVRFIVKPITLCVSTSGTTQVSPERKHTTELRLTHAFCEASSDFHRLESTDPILKRARVRQANADALASRADQEHQAARSGELIVKSNGWLLPKRGAFERRGGRTKARGAGGGAEIVAPPSNSMGSNITSNVPSVDIEETSDDGRPEEPSPLGDGEWNEGEDQTATDSDSDSPRQSQPTVSVDEGCTQRKSARQRKSRLSRTPDAEMWVECPEEKPVDKPRPASSSPGPTFQRRRRAPSNKRQGPLPPRPRRLGMPPVAEEPLIAHMCDSPSHTSAKASVAIKAVRPVRTRMSLGLRPKPSVALPRSASMEDVGKASPQVSTPAKTKRVVENKTTQGANRSYYPHLRTLVGKYYQTDIPDLLSADERNQPHTGAGAKMVWRSVQDLDPQSRGMLASYLHAAKGVVEAKQARPGVAVHVRLGGKKRSSDVDEDDNTDIDSSYAVWAISSGHEACGLVRVACSEMAQTDIPRSAIQRVQCQEQALSALVKARCVLDNFEPALEMLAGDQESPGSIEPWTLKQVRTLEKALVKEYDPNRRLHGWARPGMEMDREDFIDLAKVSEDVPGKTPSQVLSFYYKYLAAAEPLTDVVYGPEAAKPRRQEPISPVSPAHEGDFIISSNGRPTRGDANTTNTNRAVKQVSPGLCKVRAANSCGEGIESAPRPKPRVVQAAAPKPAEPIVMNTKQNHCPTINSAQNDATPTKRVQSRPAFDSVCSAPETASDSHCPDVSKHATNECTPGGGERPANADRVTGGELDPSGRVTGRSVGRQPGGERGLNGASEHSGQRRRCEVRDREFTRTYPPLPPDAEVLEVEDSDDADGGDASRNAAVLAPRHEQITSIGPAGLSWVARQLRRQAAPPVALESQPREVQPTAPRAISCNSDILQGQRGGSSDDARHGFRSEAPDSTSAKTQPRWEHPPPSPSNRHEEHMRHFDERPNGGQVESGDLPSSGFSDPGYGGRTNVQTGSEPPSGNDMFGPMAPCWRLLDRAKGYMEEDQLEYMKGLILTHVRKPMSRDQLLERAESCLQEKDKIFAAFVKIFDHIDQPPQVPLYPAKRACHPRSQWTPYSVRG